MLLHTETCSTNVLIALTVLFSVNICGWRIFRARSCNVFVDKSYGLLTPYSGCALADHVFHDGDCCRHNARALTNAAHIRNMDIVYVEHSALKRFTRSILPSTRSRFILISGKFGKGSDLTYGYRDPATIERIIKSKAVLHWFTMNPWFSHPKVSGWPYGIIHTKEYCEALSRPPLERTAGIFRSHVETSGRPWRIGVPSGPTLNIADYYKQLASHTYVISPNGDRPDCYRNYEALGLGTHPVTELNPAHFTFFAGSGLLFGQDVHNWTIPASPPPQVNTSIVFESTWQSFLARYTYKWRRPKKAYGHHGQFHSNAQKRRHI